MVNNENTKIQNKKDLKFYRFMVVMAFVVSIIIALIVGVATIDSYSAEAKVANAFIDVFMPKQIEGTGDELTKGITFYREKNEDYDVNSNSPLEAFKFYTKSENGEKFYLEDGMYYPAQFYMKDSKVQPIPVYLSFYYKLWLNLNILKNVLRVFAAILSLVVVAALIYIWYRSWSIREDKRKEQERLYNERFNKKQ